MEQRARNEPIAAFFDREACCAPSGLGREDRLTPGSRAVLRGLAEVGLEGRTVLDLGSGWGKLAREVLRAGASRVSGIDLSPGAVETARRATEAAGLAGRARFEVGDASTARLEPHDVVVLDKVICCFPDPDPLVRNSLAAAAAVWACVLPESRGPWGVVSRIGIRLENVWRVIRRDRFRAFVHDVDGIDRLVRDAGFRLVRNDRARFGWSVFVYAR